MVKFESRVIQQHPMSKTSTGFSIPGEELNSLPSFEPYEGSVNSSLKAIYAHFIHDKKSFVGTPSPSQSEKLRLAMDEAKKSYEKMREIEDQLKKAYQELQVSTL
jgi:hypothetical protein